MQIRSALLLQCKTTYEIAFDKPVLLIALNAPYTLKWFVKNSEKNVCSLTTDPFSRSRLVVVTPQLQVTLAYIGKSDYIYGKYTH